MYQEHSEFKIERTVGLPIWRYMDFWKFISLINTSKLYFPNTEGLGDQHEGRIPAKIFKMMKEQDEKLGRTNNYAENYKGYIEKNQRRRTLISSWTAGKGENFAMWKMYAKEKLGVAIKTDLESLKQSFNKTDEGIHIGEVTYYDDENPKYQIGNPFYTFLVKHKYYSFENEIRCIGIIKDEEKGMTFKNIEVDLNQLIKELYVSKFAENIGLVEIINQLKVKNGLNFEIKISGVNDNWI